MARKIKPKDSNRKDDLDPNSDEFIETATTALDWAYERRRLIGLLIVVALAVSLGVIGARHMLMQTSEKESGQLADGLESIVAPVMPSDEIPPKEQDIVAFDSSKARATESLRRFESVEEPSATIAILAEIGKAGALFDLGEYDKAVQSYEKALASKDPALSFVMPAVADSMALALSASGKGDDAVKRYTELTSGDSDVAANMARYQAARLANKNGNKEQAITLLSEILDGYKEKRRGTRLDFVFVQARTLMLALNPEAEVPPMPASGGGFNNIDPEILKQLMAQQRRGGAS